MKLLFVISLCALLLLGGGAALAQQPAPAQLSDFADAKPERCESRTAALGGLYTPDEMISVIARLGDGDTRPHLNRRRLHNVRVYWTEFLQGSSRKPETIVLAEGEPVEGYGHLEFYYGEQLVWVMKIAANADLFVGECYPPDDSYIRNKVYDPCWVRSNKIFYPCRDAKPRRRKKR